MALRAFAGGAVFAETYGSAPPRVLALHGWGRRGRDFNDSLSGLDAIAPDLPGFGASPQPDSVLGARGYSELIEDLLNEFPEPPVVVGHSFGGRVAVCLAAANPERVGPLVLTGAPLVRSTSTRKPPLFFRAVRWLNRVGLISDERLEAEKRKRGSADYRAATGVMRDILVTAVNESYEEQLAAIVTPVHLVWGEKDTEVPLAVAQAAGEIIADSRLTVLPDVGHHVPVQAPMALRSAIDEALAG